MLTIKIELPETFAIVSRDVGVEAKLADLSADIIAKLALHGLTQKVADSAAGAMKAAGFEGQRFADLSDDDKAKVQAKGKEAMAAVLESLVKGEWSERRAGESVDPRTSRIRTIFGAWLRENAKAVWVEHFKPLDAADRGPKLDEFLAGQEADFIKAIEAEADAQLAAEAKAKKKLGGLTIKTDL